MTLKPRSTCVGTLLVNSNDMQELSQAPAPASATAAGGLVRRWSNQVADAVHYNAPKEHHSECVGSLLVHTEDLQELSSAKAGDAAGGLVRRWSHQVADAVHYNAPQEHHSECVGSLLVHTTDLQELSAAPAPAPAPAALIRRLSHQVADTLNAPSHAHDDPKDLTNFGMH